MTYSLSYPPGSSSSITIDSIANRFSTLYTHTTRVCSTLAVARSSPKSILWLGQNYTHTKTFPSGGKKCPPPPAPPATWTASIRPSVMFSRRRHIKPFLSLFSVRLSPSDAALGALSWQRTIQCGSSPPCLPSEKLRTHRATWRIV